MELNHLHGSVSSSRRLKLLPQITHFPRRTLNCTKSHSFPTLLEGTKIFFFDLLIFLDNFLFVRKGSSQSTLTRS